jgi:hypothetical protein
MLSAANYQCLRLQHQRGAQRLPVGNFPRLFDRNLRNSQCLNPVSLS